MKWIIISAILIVSFSCKTTSTVSKQNTEEWTSLFNGTDLTNWDIKIADYPINENYKNTFLVEDGMIRINYNEYETFDNAYGHMYYKESYSHYKIKFDYRFVGDQIEGGATWNVRNSGIMLHSQSAQSNDFEQDFPVSIEMQLLGGLGSEERTTGNVCTPGTAVMMGDTINYNHCINSTSKTYHGDQWVSAEAIVLGGKSMQFIIENDTVLVFQKPLIGGGFISQEYQGKDWDQFGVKEGKSKWIAQDGVVLTEGYISLQAESHPIDFKNIELLNLCGCMDKKAKNYKSYFVIHDKTKCQF